MLHIRVDLVENSSFAVTAASYGVEVPPQASTLSKIAVASVGTCAQPNHLLSLDWYLKSLFPNSLEHGCELWLHGAIMLSIWQMFQSTCDLSIYSRGMPFLSQQ